MGVLQLKYTLILVCGLMFFIDDGVTLRCPKYMKHEAIREGLLNERALCNAVFLPFTEKICLDGNMAHGKCASGDCSWFGFSCDGHCLTGNDTVRDGDDSKFKCQLTTASLEQEKLCEYYQTQFDAYNAISLERQSKNRVVGLHLVPPEILGISMGLHPWESATGLAYDLKNTICPKLRFN